MLTLLYSIGGACSFIFFITIVTVIETIAGRTTCNNIQLLKLAIIVSFFIGFFSFLSAALRSSRNDEEVYNTLMNRLMTDNNFFKATYECYKNQITPAIELNKGTYEAIPKSLIKMAIIERGLELPDKITNQKAYVKILKEKKKHKKHKKAKK